MGSRNQNPGILLPILSFFFHLVQMYAGILSGCINWEKRLGLLILPYYFILAGAVVLLKTPLYQILLSSAQFPIKTNPGSEKLPVNQSTEPFPVFSTFMFPDLLVKTDS